MGTRSSRVAWIDKVFYAHVRPAACISNDKSVRDGGGGGGEEGAWREREWGVGGCGEEGERRGEQSEKPLGYKITTAQCREENCLERGGRLYCSL